jgi:hypothetical protein
MFLQGDVLVIMGSPPDRLTQLRAQIGARLKATCAGWPAERFSGLVDQVAAITLKYERLDMRPSAYDSQAAIDRLTMEVAKLARRSAAYRKVE